MRTKIFSKADLRIGRQSITNRASELMSDADFNWNFEMSDDTTRINVKKHLNMAPKEYLDKGLKGNYPSFSIRKKQKSPLHNNLMSIYTLTYSNDVFLFLTNDFIVLYWPDPTQTGRW